MAPKSGFCVLRYRKYQLVSTVSFCRFVNRPLARAPAAFVGGSVSNCLKSIGCAPFFFRYAFRKSR